MISIHALLAESDGHCRLCTPRSGISIHALLAESDAVCNQLLFDTLISIHALLAESDQPRHWSYRCKGDFYPRSPCGERRSLMAIKRTPMNDFYPRSPCGERPVHFVGLSALAPFLSTLSLRRATVVDNIVFVPGQFLSTLSLRRATALACSVGFAS